MPRKIKLARPARSPRTTSNLRADRLLGEARNCIAVALNADSSQFAAELIDEAARLATRARELKEAG